MTLTEQTKRHQSKPINLGHERGLCSIWTSCLKCCRYKTTKQSMQFSIRALVKKGLVEKGMCRQRGDSGYHRRTLGLTTLGRARAKLLVM